MTLDECLQMFNGQVSPVSSFGRGYSYRFRSRYSLSAPTRVIREQLKLLQQVLCPVCTTDLGVFRKQVRMLCLPTAAKIGLW